MSDFNAKVKIQEDNESKLSSAIKLYRADSNQLEIRKT